MKNLFINICIFIPCAMLALPGPLFPLLKYTFWGAHLFVALFVFLLPAVFFLSKQYWKSNITLLLWGLRSLAILEFLITYYQFGISSLDLVTVGGTIALTFFYEIGYFFSAAGYLGKFLKTLLWFNVIVVMYLYVIITPILIESGIDRIIFRIADIRQYFFLWPTHFGIYLVLLFWLVILVARKSRNKKYYMMLAIILPALLMTLSRTAEAALGISVLFAAWRERKGFRRNQILPILVCLAVLVSALYTGFMIKETSGSGGLLSNTILSRLNIWDASLIAWSESPVLGYGLRSFSDIVNSYEYYGQVRTVVTAHNDYVDLLVRGGLIYFFAFWLFILFVIYRGIKLKEHNGYLLPLLSYSMIAVLIAAVSANPFKDPIIAPYFWIYAGTISFYNNTSRVKRPAGIESAGCVTKVVLDTH